MFISVNSVLLHNIMGRPKKIKETEVAPENTEEKVEKKEGVVVSPPIPRDYRTAVDEILNKNFGIRIEYRSDEPMFDFIIVAPERYSTMTPPMRELLHEDIRPKAIQTGQGLLGVRTWCEIVFNSFNNEIKSLIVSDRNAN